MAAILAIFVKQSYNPKYNPKFNDCGVQPMIHTIVVKTGEIDNVEVAVNEIMEQLKPEQRLLKNSVGIISCHYEFVESGVVKAVCDRLPFDVAGTITAAQSAGGVSGTFLLSVMVLTSDDVRFKTALTESLLGQPSQAIKAAYNKADGGEKPALIFSFAGFMVENSGDEYVNTISEISGGAPCFGTLSVDDTEDFHCSYLIHCGEHYRDRMAMILLYGELSPKFYIATISDNKIINKAALITSAQGHILKEVNGRPVVDFFEELGLTKASETSYAMTSLPFMLDYGDGTPPVSKVFIGLTQEKYAVCAGSMPEGSTLYIGVFDKDDVLKTTDAAVKKALAETPEASGMLIYSCISRNMSLGGDLFAELDLVASGSEGLHYLMAYSGGEMCPTQIDENRAINRFHNNAFILCIF